MEEAPNTVTAEVANHAATLPFRKFLNGVADVTGGGSRLDRGDAAHHALIGHLAQPLGCPLDRANLVHAAGVAVPAVED